MYIYICAEKYLATYIHIHVDIYIYIEYRYITFLQYLKQISILSKKTIELDSSNESNVNNISNKNERLQSNKTPKVFFGLNMNGVMCPCSLTGNRIDRLLYPSQLGRCRNLAHLRQLQHRFMLSQGFASFATVCWVTLLFHRGLHPLQHCAELGYCFTGVLVVKPFGLHSQ